MQDNIGQVMLFTFNQFSLHVNFELLYCKCGKEKESVFRDYLIIKLVLVYR